MTSYSGFSHWKWWFSIAVYSCVKLPEGNSVAFQPLPPVCISVPSGRLSEIFPRHFPALVTAKRYKNGSRSDVEKKMLCWSNWSSSARILGILEFRNFIHGSKAKVLFWSPKHCDKSAKTQTLRIDLAWIFSRMTSWMEPVALSCYVLSQRLGHVLILLIYQYLGRSKKTIIHKPERLPILVMRRQRRLKRPFPVVPVVHGVKSPQKNASWTVVECPKIAGLNPKKKGSSKTQIPQWIGGFQCPFGKNRFGSGAGIPPIIIETCC